MEKSHRRIPMGIAAFRSLRSFCVRRGKAFIRSMLRTERRFRNRWRDFWYRTRLELKSSFRPTLGQRGERAAERFLRRKGLKILHRNFRGTHGEIDRIMLQGRTIVFVEVKTRRSQKFFEGRYRRFGPRKKIAMYRTSIAFLRRYKLTRSPVRYDLVMILCEKRRKWEIRHLCGVFDREMLYGRGKGH